MHIINKLLSKRVKSVLFGLAAALAISTTYADQELVSLFPIEHYNQQISSWIDPASVDYDKPLLNTDVQQKHLDLFYRHNFGGASPWNAEHITHLLRQSSPDDIKSVELAIIENYDNENKPDNEIGYGVNFHPHDKNWIESIAENINLSQLNGLTYQATNRGIAIDNLHGRALPTDDVHFYSHKLAGQGYPFDNLQMSALWAGTPVYIIGETRDHGWMLVITPDFIGWVKSSGIARVDNKFIDAWSSTAKYKLAAITKTQTSILDENDHFLFSAYVGSVFPATDSENGYEILAPAMDADHFAVIKHAHLSQDDASIMPLTATPHHFANIMKTLIGRTYGWGGMNFYNDCSAELKNLFTPFGIWLPRHSSQQVSIGKMVDMSAASAKNRLSYLKENGAPFLTIIYIGGHIILYIGNQHDVAMSYQNLWGLSPHPANRRAVIGKSVIFPLLLQYPEDTSLTSLADKNYFQISYLNQLSFKSLMARDRIIDIRELMFPTI